MVIQSDHSPQERKCNRDYKILVIWKNLKVGGIVGGWRNRASILLKYGIQTDFLFFYDRGGADLLEGMTRYYVINDRNRIVDLIQSNGYDSIVVIDFHEIYSILAEANYAGLVISESRVSHESYVKKQLPRLKAIYPSLLVVASQFQKSLVSKFLPCNIPIEVIPNTIDTEVFQPVGHALHLKDVSLPNDKKIIAWVGRISKGKNWKYFLEVAKDILKTRSDVHFWLITSKDSHTQLGLLRKKLQLMNFGNDLSWFHNRFSYQMMPEVYSRIADSGGVLFSTTKKESFGNVFIEAMACKCPVVAPYHSAIPEIITHNQNGKLYNLKMKKSAIQEINLLLDSKEHRQSITTAAFEMVKERYGTEGNYTLRYIHLIKEMIELNNPHKAEDKDN